jgi:hypothetical protein
VLNQQRLQRQRTAQARAASEGGGSPTAVGRREGRRQSSTAFTESTASPRALSPRSGGSSSAGSPLAAAAPPRAAAYLTNDEGGEAPS